MNLQSKFLRPDRRDTIRVGPCLVNTATRRIEHNGQVHTLEPLPMKVFLLLVDNAGQVTSTDFIIETVWGQNHVGESPVAHAIAQIRKTLGDSPRSPRFIETVPKAGYRLIAAVVSAPAPAPPAGTGSRLNAVLGGLALAAIIAYQLLAAVSPDDAEGKVSLRPLIVVLPLANLSGNTNNDRVTQGIAEELRYSLQEIRGIAVIDHYSTAEFLHRDSSPTGAFEMLGATHTLSGSLQAHGEQLRIMIRLVDNRRGIDLFTVATGLDKGDVFSTQLAISARSARKVSEHFDVTFDSDDQIETPDSLSASTPEALRAHQSYLDGQVEHALGTKDAFLKAEQFFELAVALDPQFQRAWLALTKTRLALLSHSYVDKDAGYRKAIESSDTVIQLAPRSAAAWAYGCRLRSTQNQDILLAEPFCKRAKELGPQSYAVQMLLSERALMDGDLDYAVNTMQRAVLLDPLNPRTHLILAFVLFLDGQLVASDNVIARAIDLKPDASMAHGLLGHIALARGQTEHAVSLFESESMPIYGLQGLAIAHDRNGDRNLATAALTQFQDQFGEDNAFQIAEIYGSWDETEQAIEWLLRAQAARDAGLVLMKTSPYLVGIRKDPRYLDLASRVGCELLFCP